MRFLLASVVLLALAFCASADFIPKENCNVLGLTVSTGALAPAYAESNLNYVFSTNKGTQQGTVAYTVTGVVAGTTSITFNLSPYDPLASITAMQTSNGVPLRDSNVMPVINPDGSVTAVVTFPLQEGTNVITLYFVCTNCEAWYTFTVNVPARSSVPVLPPSVIGDPQFTGLKGQSFQVHGVSDEVYNIITGSDLQLNARFVFLTEGKCPRFNGKLAKGCWSHPGTYLGEIGLKTAGGSRVHLLSGDSEQGYATVTVDGKALKDGEKVALNPTGFVHRNGTHIVNVDAGQFQFQFENSDMFINQKLRVKDWNLATHGLLGQTWRKVTKMNTQGLPIEGTVDDYTIQERDVFGDSFVFNKFQTA